MAAEALQISTGTRPSRYLFTFSMYFESRVSILIQNVAFFDVKRNR